MQEGLPATGQGTVSEADARALCLLRACEEGPADGALWSPEDAAWASRLADETVAVAAPPVAWLAARARHAQQRLLPRRARLARLAARRTWGAAGLRWIGAAAAAGFVLGLLADALGSGQQVNLLAAPAWAVVAWNLAVFVALGIGALRGGGAGWLRRGVQRWLGGGGSQGADALAPDAAPERRFAALWAQAMAPVAAARAALLLHVVALGLAAGLVAGLYARALVFDYRVGWQSTLLSAPQVHGLLATALAPASMLTGLAVPGVDAVQALRSDAAGAPLSVGTAGTAAPREQAVVWLHLLAATLAWAVALPRLLLALRAGWQARRHATRVPWPVGDAYALALLRGRRGAAAGTAVQVLPHGFAPGAAATLALRALLVAWGGERLELQVAPTTAYGHEEAAAALRAAMPEATGLAWFELAATPEPQAQGRFVAEAKSASRGAFAMLVDESGYRQRMGAASPRLAERRRAWQALADEAGAGLVCIDLLQLAAAPEAADRAGAVRALDAALAATRQASA